VKKGTQADNNGKGERGGGGRGPWKIAPEEQGMKNIHVKGNHKKGYTGRDTKGESEGKKVAG